MLKPNGINDLQHYKLRQLKDKIKNQHRLQKYIYQMELLANLRKLQPIIAKKVTDMSIHYDLNEDFRYQQGVEIGTEIGKAEGKAEGLALSMRIIKLYQKGKTNQEIAEALQIDLSTVALALKAYNETN
jgi:predicted transposase YdaD